MYIEFLTESSGALIAKHHLAFGNAIETLNNWSTPGLRHTQVYKYVENDTCNSELELEPIYISYTKCSVNKMVSIKLSSNAPQSIRKTLHIAPLCKLKLCSQKLIFFL